MRVPWNSIQNSSTARGSSPTQNRPARPYPPCDRPGCKEPGLYPAPKGRGLEGQYHRFCLDHVREYNKTYNYFAGLPDEAVAKHQKEDVVGHRPGRLGSIPKARNRKPREGERPGGFAHRFTAYDPFGLFPERDAKTAAGTPERTLKRAERKCLRQLNLEDSATKADIKARFKELVKRLHPDHNKGDRTQRTSCAK